MKLIEARIILQCRNSRRAGDVWLSFKEYGFDISKNYVYSKLSELAKQNLLVRREINDGRREGRTVYYTATSQAIISALNLLELQALQRRSGVVTANLMSYITP